MTNIQSVEIPKHIKPKKTNTLGIISVTLFLIYFFIGFLKFKFGLTLGLPSYLHETILCVFATMSFLSGITCFFRKDQKKIFAVLGTILSLPFMLIMYAVFVLKYGVDPIYYMYNNPIVIVPIIIWSIVVMVARAKSKNTDIPLYGR